MASQLFRKKKKIDVRCTLILQLQEMLIQKNKIDDGSSHEEEFLRIRLRFRVVIICIPLIKHAKYPNTISMHAKMQYP